MFSEDIDAGCDDDPEITANLDIDPKEDTVTIIDAQRDVDLASRK
jgi:hypothetical protein